MAQPHLYQNGHTATPPPSDGGRVADPDFAPRAQPTIFPADPPTRGWDALFYALHHFHMGGTPVSRYLASVWWVGALIFATGILPGRWWGVAACAVLLIGQIALGIRQRRRDYVAFTPETMPALAAAPFTPPEKAPIHVTGCFTVEGKYRRYTWLPGFYRTFPTGEHALLCHVRARRWLGVGEWPTEETGMWYVFIPPDTVEDIQWGRLRFGSSESDALAVTYTLVIPPTGRRKHDEIRRETVFIAFDQPTVGQRIVADLLHHLPADAALRSQTSTVTP